MNLTERTWRTRYADKGVAWDSEDGKHHYAGIVTGPGPILDMEGTPTSGIVEIHPDPAKSDRHPDGRTTLIPTAKIDAAHGIWKCRWMPPLAAENLLRAIHTQLGAVEKGAAIRGFLTAIAPDHKYPVGVQLILTCRDGDTVPDGKGGEITVDDEHAQIFKKGQFVTILVSARVMGFVREKAALSGLFYAVGAWSALMKMKGKAEKE